MGDASFIEELYSHNLLPNEVKDLIKSQPAQVDMAVTLWKKTQKKTGWYGNIFPETLDRAISDYSGDGSNLNKLLEIMEESVLDNLKEFAKQIKTSSTKGVVKIDGPTSGTYIATVASF